MEAPAALRQFYDEIRGLDDSSVEAHPAVVEPRKFLHNTGASSELRQSLPRSRELQHNYGAAQLACFDYIGYCGFCGGTSRHVHSLQGTPIYEIEGFPGITGSRPYWLPMSLTDATEVYVYPMLLRNHFASRDLTDQLLHRELASSNSLTNLHNGY